MRTQPLRSSVVALMRRYPMLDMQAVIDEMERHGSASVPIRGNATLNLGSRVVGMSMSRGLASVLASLIKDDVLVIRLRGAGAYLARGHRFPS